MIETINGKAYFKVGDKVYELGGGSNIITADSVEQLPDPASVPEGTIALVKSEGGGGGLPVVELTTTPSFEGSPLTETETAQLEIALANKVAVVIVALNGVPYTVVCSVTTDVDPDNACMLVGTFTTIDQNNQTLGLVAIALTIMDGAGVVLLTLAG